MLPGNGMRFVLAEDIILHYADSMFASHSFLDKMIFRVTRNADIMTENTVFDEESDYRNTVKELLKKRVKLAPVRLEIQGALKKEFIKFLCKKLELDQDNVFMTKSPLDLSYVPRLEDMIPKSQRSELLFEPLVPQESPSIRQSVSMIRQTLEHDWLLCHPYESMRPLIHLLGEAAEDPKVVSIKITLYRVGKESEIVRTLMRAAENGKDVTAVVELRARFDEEDNIEWATRLADAGCRVIYGHATYKIHSKVLLITRKENNAIQYITQIGTGNYNERTARQYTDISLITSNQEIGLDAVSLFHDILVSNIQGMYRHLLVSPLSLRSCVIDLIQREIIYALNGERAEITVKLNALTDKLIIDKLIEASKAGVQIRLMIRGICCLQAGVPGFTENIEVTSIVGRFLEHARVYCFGTGERRQVFIASADWMTRNTERRIELACPIYDKALADRIMDMLEVGFMDNVKGRVMGEGGVYYRRTADEGVPRLDSQIALYKFAYKVAGNRKATVSNINDLLEIVN